jgi:hypothetical protein
MEIILRDNLNRVYERISLTPDQEELITHNIAIIINYTDWDININNISSEFSQKKHLGKGWLHKQGLYDSLIIKFNALGIKILSAWNIRQPR